MDRFLCEVESEGALFPAEILLAGNKFTVRVAEKDICLEWLAEEIPYFGCGKDDAAEWVEIFHDDAENNSESVKVVFRDEKGRGDPF